MGIIITVAVLLLIVVVVAYGVGIYNGLRAINENVEKAWANIDVLLKQRHDELPKLIATCQGYKDFERSTLEAVIKARGEYTQASTANQKVTAASHLTGAVRGLLAVAENYPDLKTSANFIQLQNRISTLEDQIADRREFYNDSVNVVNTRIQQIPDMFLAPFMQMGRRTMYQVSDAERQDVKVEFK